MITVLFAILFLALSFGSVKSVLDSEWGWLPIYAILYFFAILAYNHMVGG